MIAGASAIPDDLREATRAFHLDTRQRWTKLILPAVFGSWCTGGITAAGGAWNASIVSEIVTYGHTTLTANGLGTYIANATAVGDTGKTIIGVAVMSVFVVGVNRLFWRPLQAYAERRFSVARRRPHRPSRPIDPQQSNSIGGERMSFESAAIIRKKRNSKDHLS